ncbi:MAG: hypothetical protein M1821_004506 [Bathelium mastoideum]|nr:MAG: hypothetical protein M1821_004506 [Bathelium mastoideum]
MAPPPRPPAPRGTMNGGHTDIDEVTVLVTGYDVFRGMAVNPSWLIANSLPPYLPSTPSCPTRIKILIPPAPIRVSYQTVVDLVPNLYPALPPPSAINPVATDATEHGHKLPFDLVVHMGISSRRPHYSMETQAHRDGYDQYEDVTGSTLPAAFGKTHWPDCPEVLRTSFDTADVLRRWQANLLGIHSADGAEVDVRTSDDAGHFLCDFVYFSSLAAYHRRNGLDGKGERPVVFLHLPAGDTEEDVLRGQETAVALIRAMVESRMAGKS